MMEALVLGTGLLAVLVALGVTAWYWGYDSSESFDSEEWERRRTWPPKKCW